MEKSLNPTLRRAVPADIEAVRQLIGENPDTILPRSADEVAELLESFWVLEHFGAVIGCACLEVYSPKIAEIRTVAVSHEQRGKGYGKLLVQAAVDEAKRQHIREVIVVTSSPEYFQKLNFGPCLNEKYALFLHGK